MVIGVLLLATGSFAVYALNQRSKAATALKEADTALNMRKRKKRRL